MSSSIIAQQMPVYLSNFSFTSASTFFEGSVKNSLFSPYSLFLGLFLSTALTPENPSPILDKLYFPKGFSMPPVDQIKLLKYYSRTIETAPPFPKEINSTKFKKFAKKYHLSEDQEFIAYILVNRILSKYKPTGTLTKDQKLDLFLSKLNSTKEDYLTKKFKKIMKTDAVNYPIIIGSNMVFTNKNVDRALPNAIVKRYKKLVFETQFPEPGVDFVNAKVEKCTRGLVKKFISASDISPNIPYFVVNTIYFKSKWKTPFEATMDLQYFNTISGGKTKVSFMKKTEDVKLAENDDYIYISLDYYKSPFTFEILMPKNVGKFPNYREDVYKNGLIMRLSQRARKMKAFIMMPKFKIETGLMNFDKVLNLGNKDTVVQKAVIIVDEEGTEAAAVTGIFKRSAIIKNPKTVVINQPFIFVLRDQTKKTVLFMGEYVDPSKKD